MASPAVKLVVIPGSSSMFPHILLRHCGIPFTPHRVTAATVNQVSDKRQVPLLILDGESITENPAIAHAIHQLDPSKQIFGTSPIEFIRVCEWLNWISGPLHAQAWSPYIRPFRFTTDDSEQATAAVKESARLKCLARYATIEAHLQKSGPWMVGKAVTAADLYLIPFYRLAARLLKGSDMADEFPHWTKHVHAISAMDAVKETLEIEQRWMTESA